MEKKLQEKTEEKNHFMALENEKLVILQQKIYFQNRFVSFQPEESCIVFESGIMFEDPPVWPTIYFEKPSSEKKGVLKNMDVIGGFETVATMTTKESGKSELNLAF